MLWYRWPVTKRPHPNLAAAARAAARAPAAWALLVAGLAACGGLSACEQPCRNDLDCSTDEGRFKCVQGACQASLPPEENAPCGEDGDCADVDEGMRCVDGRCEYAPSCQIIAPGTQLEVVVREGGAVVGGDVAVVAAADPGPCAMTWTLQGAGDALAIASIAVTSTEATGDIDAPACQDGRFSAAQPGGFLVGCSVGGATRDYVFGPQGSSPCFAPAGPCAGGASCEPMSGLAQGDAGGVCR